MKYEICKNPNNYYVLHIHSDLPCSETIPTPVPVKKVEDGTYYYAENSYGIANFGFENNDPNRRPGGGGLWSSNSEDIREALGHNTMEIVVIPKEGWKIAAAMKVDNVEKYLTDGYYIARNYGFYQIYKV